MRVNLPLAKIVYFLFFMMVGSCLPFLNAFMISSGLSAAQAGFITGMRNLFFIIGMLWNVLADYSGYCKTIMSMELFFTVVAYTPLPFIQKAICNPILMTDNITLSNSSNSSTTTMMTSTMTSLQANTGCIDKTYVTFMLLIFAASMFDFALISFTDSMVVEYVKESKFPDTYGEQRLFAAVGYAISCFFLPFLMEHVKIDSFPKYGFPFLNVFLSSLLFYPFAMKMLTKISLSKMERNLKKYNIKDVFGVVVSNYRTVMFFVVVLINGTGISLSDNFLYIYMMQEVTSSETIAGVSITVPVISEFFVFAASTYLLKFLRYPEYGIMIGSLSFFLRYLVMALSHNTILIVFVQSFHALGFSLYWVCTVEILKGFAPEEGITSLLTLTTILQQGVASLIGNILGGYIYDRFGGRQLFLYASFFLLIPFVYLSINMIFDRRKNYQVIQEEEESISQETNI